MKTNRDKVSVIYFGAMLAMTASLYLDSAPLSAISGIAFGFLTFLMLLWDELSKSRAADEGGRSVR